MKDFASIRVSVRSTTESGNIFFAIFGAVALLGILAAGTMTFIKGPLATSVKLNRQNVAENQMMIGAQVAVMSAASGANSGDCDNDAYVEPLEWRDAGSLPHPVGGGLVPMSVGIAKKDPWGTEYGYCGWDHGPQINGAGSCGGATQKRLSGGLTNAVPVVAIISAGPDKIFTTTCRTFAAADVNTDGDLLDATDLTLVSKAALTDDDVIFTYTYQEATAASGGLWTLKSGDSGTAVINKDIETTGTANLRGGVLLPDKSLITCDASTGGVMAMNGNAIELCDGTGVWAAITGGGGAANGFANNTAPCDGTTLGQVRYNSSTQLPEYCNGTQWLPFTINTPGVNLVITPNQDNAMNVDGGNNLNTAICTVPSGRICGSAVSYTVTNQGTLTSSTLSVSIVQIINGVTNTITGANLTNVSNASNFVVSSNTCNTTLAPNASCAVTVIPKANGNITYTANLRIQANNNPFAIMQGVADNFGCSPGRPGGGGIYAYCNLTDSITMQTYDLVVMPGGCTGSVTNPVCAGGTDTVTRTATGNCCNVAQCAEYPFFCGEEDYGARASVLLEAIRNTTIYQFPAAQYCTDMVYNGKSDWYLPARREMANYIFPNRVAIGGFAATTYQTTHIGSGDNVGTTNMSTGSQSGIAGNSPVPVRCARRENISLPAVPTDTDPAKIVLVPKIVFVGGGIETSNVVTVTGIFQPITVSMTGGAGMNIIRNGVSTGLNTITNVTNGTTLQFQMAVPSILGTRTTATINIGPDSYSWSVGYADASKEAMIFVTPPGSPGALGGLSGADAICNSVASASTKGLSSAWKAILSDDAVAAASRIPWNWGILKNTNGNIVVDGGISDLFDGALDAPVGYDHNGNASGAFTWTATLSTGEMDPGSFSAAMGSANHGCNNWTSNYTYDGNYTYSMGGYANQQSSGWISATGGTCAGGYSLYCIEDVDNTSDTTPAQLIIPYKIQVPAGARISSDPLVISGMSPGATQTLNVTATGGTPAFTINGGADVTSGTIRNGDNIVFKLTAAATASTSYKMTITAGAMTAYWRIWTGDPTGAATKRAFVTSAVYNGNLGGLAGADAKCQSQAAGAGLGGTWKALLSDPGDENNWAINRIGYNWSTLKLVDGVDVATAGQLWSGPLLNPLNKNQSGGVLASTSTYSNTRADGRPFATAASSGCSGYTSGANYYDQSWGVVGATASQWVEGGNVSGCYPCSDSCYRLYCIEQ